MDYTICRQKGRNFSKWPSLSFRFLEHPYHLIIACQQEKVFVVFYIIHSKYIQTCRSKKDYLVILNNFHRYYANKFSFHCFWFYTYCRTSFIKFCKKKNTHIPIFPKLPRGVMSNNWLNTSQVGLESSCLSLISTCGHFSDMADKLISSRIFSLVNEPFL